MGTGKTAVGHVLAEKLGMKFIEIDTIIEEKAGKSITEIFQQDGETTFRKMEIDITRDVAGEKNSVIACGGGIILNKINIDQLRENSIIVYLTASPDIILKRTSEQEGQRPLLDVEEPLKTINEMLKFRKPFYTGAADMAVDTSMSDIDNVTEKIIEKLKENESFNFTK
jgi:shikimate kinase